MGIDKITKLLKRCNKGKNTITMSIVVAFLLGSNLSYGEIYIKYDKNNNEVKIYETKLENGNETEIEITDNRFGEIENKDNVFTWKYNGVLSEKIFLDDSLFNKDNNITFNIENNGIIGKQIGNKVQDNNKNDLNKGNGIGIYSKEKNLILGNILNNGIITGSNNESATERYSNIGNGIGIYNYDENKNNIELSLGDILNNGIIKGSINDSNSASNVGNGIGIYNFFRTLNIKNILNNGIIAGSKETDTKYNSNMGNGIGIYNYNGTLTLGDILNNVGNIENNGISKGTENGIQVYNHAGNDTANLTIKNNILNSGISQGNKNGLYIYSYALSYNIETKSELTIEKNILNSGISQGTENGLYIYNHAYNSNLSNSISNLTIKNILNNGTSKGIENNGINIENIKDDEGTATITINNILNSGLTQGNKNGLYFHNENGDVTLNGKIQNIGTIIGETEKGVDFSSSDIADINNKYSNYGVVVGKNGNDGLDKNSGIYITLNNGTPTIDIGAGGEVKNTDILQFDKNGEQITDTNKLNYYIINAQLDKSKTATETINSSELDKKIENDKLINSENRKNFVNADGSFSNLIINGAENTLTIGTNNTQTSTSDENLNNLTISNSVINSYKNSVVFGASGGTLTGTNIIINTGNFNKDEDDKITTDDNSNDNKIISNAITGEKGKDEVNLNNSIINGNIDLSFNDDKVTDNTDNTDNLTISNGTIINGNIILNNDTFTAFTSNNPDNSSTLDDSNINSNSDILTTINGDITSTNSELTFTDTIVNGNIDLNGGEFTASSSTPFSKGNDSDTTTKTTINGDIKNKNGTLLLESSVINGDVKISDSGKGEISGISVVNGNINYSGNGDNDTAITEHSWINGDINIDSGKLIIGDGKYEFKFTPFNTGYININGDINVNATTGGELALGNNILINGNINFTGKELNLTIDKYTLKQINGKITTNTDVKNLKLAYSVGDSTKDTFKTHLNIFSEFNKIQLADEGNTVDLTETYGFDGTIVGGNGTDEFTLNNLDVKISDNTSGDNDKITLNFALGADKEQENNEKLQKFENIENLQLADKENTINVSGLSFKKIYGGNSGNTFKNVSVEQIGNILGGSGKDEIYLGEAVENNLSFNKINNNVEMIYLSNSGSNKLTVTENDISNLEKINFGSGSGNDNVLTLGTVKEWDFSQKTNLINGNTKIDINSGTINLGEANANSQTITLNTGFINGDVTFSNGTIKITPVGLTFNKGTDTEKYKFDSGTVDFADDVKLESYAFLNVDKEGISVLSWKELVEKAEITGIKEDYSKYAGNYELYLKQYGENSLVRDIFNHWKADEIVNVATNEGIKDLGDFTFKDNRENFGNKGVASTKTLTINTDNGNEINSMTFGAFLAKKLEIKNNLKGGDNIINFKGTTTIEAGIDATNSTEKLILNFNDSTSVGNISFGKNSNKINISDALNIDFMGAVKAEDGGNVQINISNISKGGDDGFNHVLAGANAGKNNSVVVKDMNENEINIRTNYCGKLTLNKSDITANIFGVKDFTGTILFKDESGKLTDNNSVNIKNSTVSGNGTIEMGASGEISLENSHINDLKVNTSNNNSVNITIGDKTNFEDKGLSLGNGDDTATLISTDKNIHVVINGGGNTTGDIFNVGQNNGSLKTTNSFDNFSVLTGNITDFENININKNITFGYVHNDSKNSLQISGTNKITIADGKTLGLQIDYDKKDTSSGKVIGYALYNKGITITGNSNGKIYISTKGAGNKQIIDFSNVKLEDFENEENIFTSGSTAYKVTFIDEDDDGIGDNVLLELNSHIMGDNGENIKYAHLDKIYQSILSAGKIDYMDKSTNLEGKGDTEQEAIDNSIKAQLEYYRKIYHSSPYAYSNEVSKKSAELITNSLLENKVMPDLNKWTFGGSIAGREADNNTNYYGQNLHKVDIGKNEVSAESNIYGAYAFGEYGIKENSSIGFAIAGTNGTTDISGGSKLESNAVFVSAYAKQNLGNLNLMAGLGYQHSFYDSTRVASNNFQSTTVDKKYEDDLFTIFAGARYIYNLGNGFSLEPNAKLNISHVMQNDIDEDDSEKDITIEVDSKDFTSIDTEIGVDVVKKVNIEKGKLSFKAGVSLIYALDGYEDEFLNARVVGATKDFEIISPENDRTRVKFNLGTEYELENGMFYNLHGNYTTSSHDTDYSVSFGAGYKF